MAEKRYDKFQSLNDWNRMLADVYDKSQNYSKNVYEVYSHLSEVTGGFGKYFVKKLEYDEAKKFIPKIFSWGLALIRKVNLTEEDKIEIDRIIFEKFPGVCIACLSAPCGCGFVKEDNKKNITVDDRDNVVNEFIGKNCKKTGDRYGVIDVQNLFTKIYSTTWTNRADKLNLKGIEIDLKNDKAKAYFNICFLYDKLVEELAEISESIRFYHLYKTNFRNEIADFFAWFFAIVSMYHLVYDEPDSNKIDLEELLWNAYPGFCVSCKMPNCVCRSGPVRELLSKPSSGKYRFYDEVSQTENKEKLEEHLRKLKNILKSNQTILPIATIKFTLINYSEIKQKEFGKEVIDESIKVISNTIRKKIRFEKDRFYRKQDDELLIISNDTFLKESEALKERIEEFLNEDITKAIELKLLKIQKESKGKVINRTEYSVVCDIIIELCNDNKELDNILK
jgi:GGDEF domain-containing protein